MERFTRRQRLTHPAQFQYVFAAPQRFGDRHVTVLARPNVVGRARLGLAVGRRKIARASQRNTFKRVVRESFRTRQDELNGYDIVVLPKRTAALADRRQLRTSIDRQWDLLTRQKRRA
jgi:ribonuclease P protein component